MKFTFSFKYQFAYRISYFESLITCHNRNKILLLVREESNVKTTFVYEAECYITQRIYLQKILKRFDEKGGIIQASITTDKYLLYFLVILGAIDIRNMLHIAINDNYF